MPPKKQKRPVSQQKSSKTLHDFFGATPSKASTSSSNTKATRSKAIKSEIIVIDDSDDEVEVVEGPYHGKQPQKRRKLSPSTSQHKAHSSAHSGPTLPTTDKIESLSLDMGFKVSFGSPVLLSDPQSGVIHSHTNNSGPPLQFGAPMLLQDDAESPRASNSNSSLSLCSASSKHNDPVFEDWQNEDDENMDSSMGAEGGQIIKEADDSFLEDYPMGSYKVPVSEDGVLDNADPRASPLSVARSRSALRDGNKERVVHPEKLAPISSRSDAFTKMMSSVKENDAWREASKAEKGSFARGKGNRTKAPFYKVLQGMPIAVDAFKYGAIPGVTAYFLTHAHSDHYTNLSSTWKHGPIYCSEATAKLVIHMLSVDPKWVHPLPMDQPVEIPDTQGVSVTLIEANHCPGSCLFFFEGRQTVNAGDSTFKSSYVGSSRIFRYLHCGDFRASPRHVLHPAVKGKDIDHVYLDTTYLDPRYTFPPQPLVIDACAELARRVVFKEPTSEKSTSMISWLLPATKGKEKEQTTRKSLVVVGTYSIGKERIVKAIAQSLNSKVYCDSRKAAILRCQVDPELDALLTTDPTDALVHLVPLGTISTDQLQIYLKRFSDTFDRVIGFRPTGWTYSQPAGTDQLPSIAAILSKCSHKGYTHSDLQLSAKSTATLQLYAVPYSEHSSFFELTCFALSFNWNKMIATVNVGSENSRNKMNGWIHKWEIERRRSPSTDVVPYRHLDYW